MDANLQIVVVVVMSRTQCM